MPVTRQRETEKSKSEQSIPDGYRFDLLHTARAALLRMPILQQAARVALAAKNWYSRSNQTSAGQGIASGVTGSTLFLLRSRS